jgi:SYF2 splicing factor
MESAAKTTASTTSTTRTEVQQLPQTQSIDSNVMKDEDEIDLDDDNEVYTTNTTNNTIVVTATLSPTMDTATTAGMSSNSDVTAKEEQAAAAAGSYSSAHTTMTQQQQQSPPTSDSDRPTTTDTSDGTEQVVVVATTTTSSIQLRMRQLKQKINQARQLNQQAVREEGEGIAGLRHSNSHSRTKQASYLETNGIDTQLHQPAYENMVQQQKKTDQKEMNQYAINDYHNPQGQYRHYVRDVKSLPTNNHQHHHNRTAGTGSTTMPISTGMYDPTDTASHSTTVNDIKQQRDGAHIVAQELHRRYEKRQTQQQKRKLVQIRQEINDTSNTGTASGSGINLRNQKFNEKIARTFDTATTEIRHNLERGTAL